MNEDPRFRGESTKEKMQTLPPFRQLQYLVALHHHRSFSRAADACNVTQSTFSAGIAALETLLGHQLINRSTRHLTFTALGEEIIDKSKNLIARAGEIMALAKNAEEGLSGPLRLGIIPTIAPYLLPALLPAVSKEWPDLDLQLHEDLSSRLVEKLQAGKLDILLLAFPFPTPGYKQMTVFSEDFVLASSSKENTDKPVDQAELENIDLLLLEEGHCLRSHALSACRTQSPTVRKTFSATSLQTLIQMVQHGSGVTLLPEMATRPDALPKGLYLRRFQDPAPTRDIGLVWQSGSIKDQDIADLARTIKKLAAPR